MHDVYFSLKLQRKIFDKKKKEVIISIYTNNV